MKNGITITKEEMAHLKDGDYISSLIVNYILKKRINNDNIYLFETLEPSYIDKLNNDSLLSSYQDAILYPTWICPFCDNGHFTLFVVHIINQTDSFEKSCVLYFDSLPLFHSDIKRHLDIIKRICYCIGTQFDEKLFQIPVPQQKTNDCGCCVCYFATKYAENVP